MATAKMRVKSCTYQDYSGYQVLQQKRWWGWQTIDREEVPAHVRISSGAFGDTGGWVSKFNEYGRFGRDGMFTPTLNPSEENGYERTPWLLRLFGKAPLRKWVRMVHVGGDFSYWEYAEPAAAK